LNKKEEEEYTELLKKMDLQKVYKNRITAMQRLEQFNTVNPYVHRRQGVHDSSGGNSYIGLPSAASRRK